jgi:site-specific DNA recombinase
MHENALKGKHTGGIAPLGYDVDPDSKMLVINEHEAKVVRLIFQRTIECVGYTKIIKELNGLGYKTKTGNKFSKTSLYSILTNEKYTGLYVFNRSVSKDMDGKRSNKSKDEAEIVKVEGIVPVIISREDFEKAAEVKISNRNTESGQAHSREVYLLSGKIICGVCGNKYVGTRNKCGRNKSILVRYGCNRRHRGTVDACSNKEIRREYIETFVLEKLSALIFDDKLIPAVAEQYNKKISELNKTGDSELAVLNKNLRSLNKKIDNIVNLMAESGSASLMSKLSEFEEEREIIELRVKKLSRQSCDYIDEDFYQGFI